MATQWASRRAIGTKSDPKTGRREPEEQEETGIIIIIRRRRRRRNIFWGEKERKRERKRGKKRGKKQESNVVYFYEIGSRTTLTAENVKQELCWKANLLRAEHFVCWIMTFY